MELTYLREFVAVAKNANVTKTAQLLNMSQPVLSKHIATVEKEVGCQLFSRDGGQFSLTPLGKVYLADAQRLLLDYDESLHRIQRLKKVHPTRVSVTTYVSCKPTDDLIRKCRAILKHTHPLMEVYVKNACFTSPIADVATGQADVSLVSGEKSAIAGLKALDLFEEPLTAVVRRNHRLAEYEAIEPADLNGEIIWNSFAAPVARHYLAIRDMLEKLGVDASFVEIPFNGSVDGLELDFDRGVYIDGAGIVAHSLPLLSLTSDYIAIPLKSDIRLSHRALYLANDKNPAIEHFLHALSEVLKTTDMNVYW